MEHEYFAVMSLRLFDVLPEYETQILSTGDFVKPERANKRRESAGNTRQYYEGNASQRFSGDDGGAIETCIGELLDIAERNKDLFQELNQSGAVIELYITYLSKNHMSINQNLVRRAAECKLQIGID